MRLYGLAALVVFPEGDPSLLARLVSAAALATASGLAVTVFRWGAAWARAAVMLLIGFTMMAVAGGVVAKRPVDEVALVDVLGVAASVAGVILVIAGWRVSLTGIARRWARIAIATISTLLVAQFLLLPAGIALDVTNRPRPTGSSRTPADVDLRFQDVRIRSADGTLLSAWWVAPQNGAVIVLLPGSGSTRDAVLDHAALVARHGGPFLGRCATRAGPSSRRLRQSVADLRARGRPRARASATPAGRSGDPDRGAGLMISGAPSNEQKLDPVYTDAAPDVITLWSLPDTPHTRALRTHPVEYERRVMAVFDGSLLEDDLEAQNG